MAAAALALAGLALFAPQDGANKAAAAAADPSDAFFKKGEIPRLKLELAPEDVEKLRANPREWVHCRVRENEKTVYEGVSVKLKGSAGSFREFDDKPALTLKMDRDDDAARFHGLAKFHLNNSVQDDTYLREWVGSELFRAAGVATPRVTHARVWINDRDVGLYVLKEGFDKLLLKRFFKEASGNLYDGGFCQDVDADLNKECGKGSDDRADLKALRVACEEPDLAKRWAKLDERVDVKSFLTFVAMELMLAHWDGYSLNRNNYRLYFEPKTGKAYFLAHGMDQVLGDAHASILDAPTALIAANVMKNPEWRAAYRKRVGELLPLFDAVKLGKRIDEVSKRVATVLAAADREAGHEYEARARDLKNLVEAREKSLREQKSQPDPKPLVFTPDVPVKIEGWHAMSESEDAKVAEEKANGERRLVVACGKSGRCVAGFRRGVLLAKGRYRLAGALLVKDVAALADADAPGVGAGLRISGAKREGGLVGSDKWKAVQFEFEVAEEQRDVELVVELRAAKGRLEVKPESLKLTRLGG
jgi:hypothetical protein